MNLKVYEPKSILCKVCNEKESLIVLFCEINEEVKALPVCLECENKVPYNTISITTTLGKACFNPPSSNER